MDSLRKAKVHLQEKKYSEAKLETERERRREGGVEGYKVR